MNVETCNCAECNKWRDVVKSVCKDKELDYNLLTTSDKVALYHWAVHTNKKHQEHNWNIQEYNFEYAKVRKKISELTLEQLYLMKDDAKKEIVRRAKEKEEQEIIEKVKRLKQIASMLNRKIVIDEENLFDVKNNQYILIVLNCLDCSDYMRLVHMCDVLEEEIENELYSCYYLTNGELDSLVEELEDIKEILK